ncbi:MAG TPA: fumarylacetoacetate hydrolase family protein [Puia sp.]|jgi:2-dehydro-3-deoxy-D-arabinonate dehydratase|nr:fumarylacetoacetate hydrolase family protein [Puia sp.]
MKLYKLKSFALLEYDGEYFSVNQKWDDLINREDLHGFLTSEKVTAHLISAKSAKKLLEEEILPPIGSQEVWAAGVTYMRSRNARMEESKESGGASFYDKVYEAERPELFFKSFAHRVAGHNQQVYIRKDSSWNVPEPELTLFINSSGNIQGYTIGNDMSSRSIEGENPLYLPQAKMYERSAALGPCLFISKERISANTKISIQILRDNKIVFDEFAEISRMKRSFKELIGFLYREYSFPHGCFLMTGTCLVPGNDFTLLENDKVIITIDNIGTLSNTVAFNGR